MLWVLWVGVYDVVGVCGWVFMMLWVLWVGVYDVVGVVGGCL